MYVFGHRYLGCPMMNEINTETQAKLSLKKMKRKKDESKGS